MKQFWQLWKLRNLGLLYSVFHCKDCESISHSLVVVHVKFNMASNLTKVYGALKVQLYVNICQDKAVDLIPFLSAQTFFEFKEE